MIKLRNAATLPLILFLAGCGPELVGSAGQGEVQTAVTSEEAGSPSSSPSAVRSLEGLAPLTTRLPAEGQGTLTFVARVTLVTAGGEIPLTAGAAAGSFRIDGADSAYIGKAGIGAGQYTRVRVEFTRVEASVTGGITVGGVPLLGDVRVQLGATPAVVEAPVQLAVREGATHTVVVDLNAHAWLPRADLLSKLVPRSAFVEAVEVRVM